MYDAIYAILRAREVFVAHCITAESGKYPWPGENEAFTRNLILEACSFLLKEANRVGARIRYSYRQWEVFTKIPKSYVFLFFNQPKPKTWPDAPSGFKFTRFVEWQPSRRNIRRLRGGITVERQRGKRLRGDFASPQEPELFRLDVQRNDFVRWAKYVSDPEVNLFAPELMRWCKRWNAIQYENYIVKVILPRIAPMAEHTRDLIQVHKKEVLTQWERAYSAIRSSTTWFVPKPG